jgi:hypothetical protein
MKDKNTSAEQQRLNENALKEVPLEKWGPYLSERQWGTIREDYSENGDAWNYFTHDHARSRAYRWGEDGLGGISDYFQNLCFAVALWNHKDPILKERLFGLTNYEGNHGEDVKELYYYLDNVPTHYYMKYLYKYPQAAFPYEDIIVKNGSRNREQPEYEILDTGVFNDNKYFDVFIEYAKENSEDIFIKIEIANRGEDPAPITVLPTLWFYNRWQYAGLDDKPEIVLQHDNSVKATHPNLENYYLYFEGADDVLFTENETNNKKILGKPNDTVFVKDAFHEAVMSGNNIQALRDKKSGTKFSPVYYLNVEGKSSKKIYLRLSNKFIASPFKKNFEKIFELRKKEADAFYENICSQKLTPEIANIQRQAFAGLLWSKQYYHYDIERWLNAGDGITPVTPSRLKGRNTNWKYLKNQDIIAMPDKWEYPWYASWDTAFHCIAISIIDPVFAKNQLIMLMREWYMNPEGQLPAYEWNFSDVNPPVHALAALEVYRREKEIKGEGDVQFLKRIFQKLIINFTWWTNRKDKNGNNIFEGGFLGLDNIGVFNRSSVLPGDAVLEQADGTSWMGMYALNMMDIALEIACCDNAFEDACTKFYEHFVLIAEALNELGLWNEDDNFFYDVLSCGTSASISLKVRSIVGVIPLFAVSVISKEQLDKLKDFKKRMTWFINHRTANKKYLPNVRKSENESMLLSLVHKDRLVKVLDRLLDESEFLSIGGIRALSKHYRQNPYTISIDGTAFTVEYDPADSTSGLFGGNSNWRGPVWMPINYLVIKAIQKYGDYYGDTIKIECPKGSGVFLTLHEVSILLINRLVNIFREAESGDKPVYDTYNWFYKKVENKELLLFHEYFDGENSRGLGASHQTGWTALITDLIRYVK